MTGATPKTIKPAIGTSLTIYRGTFNYLGVNHLRPVHLRDRSDA